jgi:hypothetical protein
MISSNGHNDDLARVFNEKCHSQLVDANFRNRFVIIGSGPSSPIVAPLKKLLEKFEEKCGKKQKRDEKFWNFCERAFRSNRLAYYDVIRDSFESTPHFESVIYQNLLAIKFKSYITLNYDKLLPYTFKIYQGTNYAEHFTVYPVRKRKSNELPLTTLRPADLLNKRCLVAIHGYCDDQKNPNWPREVILKRSDYNKHYFSQSTNQYLYGWWKELLTLCPCVFIGTSLEEPGLFKVVDDLRKANHTEFLKHDHIHLKDVGQSKNQPHYPTPEKTLDVFRQILFDPLNDKFTGLLNILSMFSGLDPENASPGTVAPSEIPASDKYPPK